MRISLLDSYKRGFGRILGGFVGGDIFGALIHRFLRDDCRSKGSACRAATMNGLEKRQASGYFSGWLTRHSQKEFLRGNRQVFFGVCQRFFERLTNGRRLEQIIDA